METTSDLKEKWKKTKPGEKILVSELFLPIAEKMGIFEIIGIEKKQSEAGTYTYFILRRLAK